MAHTELRVYRWPPPPNRQAHLHVPRRRRGQAWKQGLDPARVVGADAHAYRLLSELVEPTIYEVMGGANALLALAEAWHKRCLADPILAHPFEGGVHPQHTERLAAYWSEQLGGPTTYSESIADYSHVVRVHSGNGPHEQMDGRAVAAFVLALDDVGIPNDERLRFQLIAWFTWATAMLNHRWSTRDEVPSDLPLPAWGWEGTEGW